VTRRLIVEADGGSRGNPGPAGYGALVRDAETGRVLAERAASVGRATNNVAEYGGLVAGLQAALDLDPSAEVEVRMDSKLVVEQMSGRWQVKHPDMRQLAKQAQQIARQLGSVRYTWVPRAQNGAADALANSAMDGKPIHRDAAAEPVVLEDDIQPTAGGPVPERSSVVQPTPEPAPVVTTVTHLLRHGQTEHTPERRFSGRNDLPLSRTGRAEAEAAAERAKHLGVEVVIASPLRRTRETAEIVAGALGLPVAFDQDLVELDFGDLEGLTFDEAAAKHPLAARRFMSDVTVSAPGGESIADVSTRVSRARRRILAEHAGRTVLIVSHVTPIKLLLTAGLAVGDEAVHRVFLEAASLCTVTWSSDGRSSVRAVNDTAHLRETRTKR
jgi:ribonuclease H / adenosylcobalamin/alpha-ribazole phosphatase